MPLTSELFTFTYELPLTPLRYTLYPTTDDVLAPQFSATECDVTGAVPFPLRATLDVEPVALLKMFTLPLAVPVVVGANCTLTEVL
jgi:hypothetical protein